MKVQLVYHGHNAVGVDLMAKCGHRLFRGGDESMFAVLNEEEAAVLKKILGKLLS